MAIEEEVRHPPPAERVNMKWCARILIAVGLWAIWLSFNLFREGGTDFLQIFALCILVGIPLIFIGRGLLRKVEAELQETKDVLAAKIAETHEDSKKAVVVYLRPFASTNQYRVSHGARSWYSSLVDGDAHDDVERIVARALHANKAFVALGQPGEHHGAGRLLVDEASWKEHVIALCDRAFALIVLPSFREGTLWEVQQILDRGWLQKAIFFMPPSDGKFYQSDVDVPQEWNATKAACIHLGLTLPDPIPRGALFRYISGTTKPRLEDLPRPDPTEWADCINWLLQLRVAHLDGPVEIDELAAEDCVAGLLGLGYSVTVASSGVWEVQARHGGAMTIYGSAQLRATYLRLRSE